MTQSRQRDTVKEKGGEALTDQEMINEIIKDGLLRMAGWTETDDEKKEIVLGQIAKEINSTAKTVRNAKCTSKQVLGKDKSKLLDIYAKKRGIK